MLQSLAPGGLCRDNREREVTPFPDGGNNEPLPYSICQVFAPSFAVAVLASEHPGLPGIGLTHVMTPSLTSVRQGQVTRQLAPR